MKIVCEKCKPFVIFGRALHQINCPNVIYPWFINESNQTLEVDDWEEWKMCHEEPRSDLHEYGEETEDDA